MNSKVKSILAAAGALAAMGMPWSAMAGPWGGIYAGIHAGYGTGDTDWDYQSGGTADHDIDGALGGVQVGYNYEINQFVLGAEVDASLMSINGDTLCPNPAFSCESELNYGGSARLRAGYATGAWLLYGTGGFAVAESTVQTNLGGTITGTDELHTGWTAGAGVEYIWTPAISVRGEWRYTDLGSETHTVDNGLLVDADHEYHQFTVGLNWHF